MFIKKHRVILAVSNLKHYIFCVQVLHGTEAPLTHIPNPILPFPSFLHFLLNISSLGYLVHGQATKVGNELNLSVRESAVSSSPSLLSRVQVGNRVSTYAFPHFAQILLTRAQTAESSHVPKAFSG